jgi:hypothetical protein
LPIFDVPYMQFQFAPTAAFPQGRIAKRPVVQLRLTNGMASLSCFAIVDSGADYCAFPRSFMQPLGLDALVAPLETTSGVGSSNVPVHFCSLEMDFGVVKIPVYAGFTTGLDQLGIGLLGQSGFFDQFHIHFRCAHGIFQIEIP